jgi:hypothetical protein
MGANIMPLIAASWFVDQPPQHARSAVSTVLFFFVNFVGIEFNITV